MTAPFVNIHTHKRRGTGIELYNCRIPDDVPADGLITAGLHPWDIDKCNHLQAIGEIERLSRAGVLCAIGETGIDRAIGVNINLQKELFIKQLSIAESHNLPVIVHCVRAVSDVLQIVARHKPTVPIIMHGFVGNIDAMRQLTSHGIFISFGAGLLRYDKVKLTFAQTADSQFFLETDDADIGIAEFRCSLPANNIRRLLCFSAAFLRPMMP